MTILVTGAAGFIGYHLSERLLAEGHRVVGADNVNDYYSVALKQARLDRLGRHPGFSFERVDLAESPDVTALFKREKPSLVAHLAAQAGVRYSLENPEAYTRSNLVAFSHILEQCRRAEVEHLVYASSSSVYGSGNQPPFSEDDRVDRPISLYAATKRSNELMAFSYSHLFRLPVTGLRFFTVYGPWGRPDMAYFKFTDAILEGRPIDVYNHGDMRRDFTYVDDIVEGIVRVLRSPSSQDPPYRLYNIGARDPVGSMDFIGLLEERLERKASIRMLPMQPGDVLETCADVTALSRDVGFAPNVGLAEGLTRFVSWYRAFYRR